MAAAQAFVQAVAAPVVALAVREHDRDVVAWAERGATGIVTRRASLDDLVHAVLAARGECGCTTWVASALLRRVAEVGAERRRPAPHAELTLREREIGALLVEGLSNKEIAARLLLGVSTVKNHVHNLLGKVDARTRAEAVALLLATQDPGLSRPRSGSRARVPRLRSAGSSKDRPAHGVSGRPGRSIAGMALRLLAIDLPPLVRDLVVTALDRRDGEGVFVDLPATGGDVKALRCRRRRTPW